MNKTQNRYSVEFKKQAVELSNLRGKIKEVAEELGISSTSLKTWKKEFEQEHSFFSKSKEAQENARLRKALQDVTLERDILKEAVSIFSKNDK